MKEFLNKREPIIAIKEFKFLNRIYKKGDLFDRRRVKIRIHTLKRFMDGGFLCFAKSMDKKELESLGWAYDGSNSARYPLLRVEDKKTIPEHEEDKSTAETEDAELGGDVQSEDVETKNESVEHKKQIKFKKNVKRK